MKAQTDTSACFMDKKRALDDGSGGGINVNGKPDDESSVDEGLFGLSGEKFVGVFSLMILFASQYHLTGCEELDNNEYECTVGREVNSVCLGRCVSNSSQVSFRRHAETQVKFCSSKGEWFGHRGCTDVKVDDCYSEAIENIQFKFVAQTQNKGFSNDLELAKTECSSLSQCDAITQEMDGSYRLYVFRPSQPDQVTYAEKVRSWIRGGCEDPHREFRAVPR